MFHLGYRMWEEVTRAFGHRRCNWRIVPEEVVETYPLAGGMTIEAAGKPYQRGKRLTN